MHIHNMHVHIRSMQLKVQYVCHEFEVVKSSALEEHIKCYHLHLLFWLVHCNGIVCCTRASIEISLDESHSAHTPLRTIAHIHLGNRYA